MGLRPVPIPLAVAGDRRRTRPALVCKARITALELASQYPAHGLAAAIQAAQARHLPPHSCCEVSLACALFPADERPVTGLSLDGFD